MTWEKTGRIFDTATEKLPNAISHASFPTPLLLKDRIRIYYAPRCQYADGVKSVISFLDVDRDNPAHILYQHDRPVLEPGALGTFDDCGVQPNCAVTVDHKIYLYYLGWNPGVNILARNNTGLAISEDGGVTFRRAFEGPVLDRTRFEPYFAYTPWVIKEDDAWRAWYGSGTAWVKIQNKAEGLFETKYAFSDDGIVWTRPNITCIKPEHPLEVNCRPTVLKINGRYGMWVSVRQADDFRAGGKNGYRILYAESTDGQHWQRLPMTSTYTVLPSEVGFDDEMVCFSGAVRIDKTIHLFYNGNGFGFTGIGHAKKIFD